MPDLAKQPAPEVVRFQGQAVATCNHPSTTMTVDEIKAARLERINPGDFADSFALVCERFDKDLSDPLLKQFYETIGESMGASEFRAAYRDFWKTEMFFANVVPFFVKHAQKQRENIDLIGRGMSEVYKRGGS